MWGQALTVGNGYPTFTVLVRQPPPKGNYHDRNVRLFS